MGVREEITERIIKALETGVPPWQAGWSSGSLAFNAETGKPYQGINQILLGMQGRSSSRWLTLKQANRMGCRVKKGEKSTRIVRLVEVDRETADKDDQAEGIAHDQHKLLVMRHFDVFNEEQIEGLAPLPPKPQTFEPADVAEGVLGGMKATGLMVMHGGDVASYSPKLDLVRMPDKSSFHSSADYYATLMHELSHSTGSAKRLNRQTLAARFGSVEYAKEELRAEISSAMILAELNLPISAQQRQKQIESSAAYVESWLSVLRNDKNEIFRAASQAQHIVDYLQEHAIILEPGAKEEMDRDVNAAPQFRPTARPAARPAMH